MEIKSISGFYSLVMISSLYVISAIVECDFGKFL